MNTVPSSNERARYEILLQRYFEKNISMAEAEELAAWWDANRDFDEFAVKNMDVNLALRLFTEFGRRPIRLSAEKNAAIKEEILLHPAGSPFKENEFVDLADALDFDELIRISSESIVTNPPPLPPPSVRENKVLRRLKNTYFRIQQFHSSRTFARLINRTILLGVFALLVVLGSLVFFGGTASRPTASVSGRLLGFQGVRWAVEPSCDVYGLDLISKRLSTLSGKVAMKLGNGADILLEGASDLEILSSNEIDCRRGKFHLAVPQQSEPFRVRLPQFTVVVLGTAFIVEADGKGSTIHLTEGRVRLEGMSGEPIVLEAGEALNQTSTGHRTKFDVVPEPTLSFSEWEKESADRLFRWKQQRDQIRKDPASEIYLTFDRALTKDKPSDRMNWVLGRFPGKWGLNFPEAKNDLSLRIDKNYSQATVMAWLRRESSAETRKTFFQTKSARWEFTNSGGIRWQTKNGNGDTEVMPVPYELAEQWLFVAVVLDMKAGHVKHYLNGKEILVQQNAEPISRGPLKLGGGVRIDEFLFSERIYSAGEIEEIYLAGK